MNIEFDLKKLSEIRNDIEDLDDIMLCDTLWDIKYLMEAYGEHWREAQLAIEKELAHRYRKIIIKAMTENRS